VVLEEFGGSSI